MPFVASVGTLLCCGGSSQRVTGCSEGSELHVRPNLHESRATEEHLAVATVTNHRHGMNSPKARLPFEITMEHALNAPTAVTPFRQHDCAPQMHGALRGGVDVAGVHDFLTGIAPTSYEDLGFAERLGGYPPLDAAVTSVAGARPVNPSGGLAAKDHPPAATGLAQYVELFHQLRGEAVNEVDGARIALAHNVGGPTADPGVTDEGGTH